MADQRVAVITGAAKGIGRYVAKTFAQDNAAVVVVDIVPLDNIVKELEELGANYSTFKCDVRSPSDVQKLMKETHQRFGRIDVLVNNAAIVTHFPTAGATPWPRIRDMDETFWDRVIQTNLGGTFLCTKHVLPYMEEQASGHVINVYGGGRVTVTSCAYVVSKDAIRTFTRYVAEEERPYGVCVVAISPGASIATEEASEEIRKRVPGPEFVGNRYVLASKVGMEMSGSLLTMKNDRLVVQS